LTPFASYLQDLTTKSFLEVCGDLNVVVTILVLIYFCPHVLFSYRTPMAVCLVSCKLLMSYFGQLCHCMSHMPDKLRPDWVVALQNAGLMISTKEHMQHHKTYDDNYCIGTGICNPIIRFLLNNVTKNKWAWLTVFCVSLICDVPVANWFFTSCLGFK